MTKLQKQGMADALELLSIALRKQGEPDLYAQARMVFGDKAESKRNACIRATRKLAITLGLKVRLDRWSETVGWSSQEHTAACEVING